MAETKVRRKSSKDSSLFQLEHLNAVISIQESQESEVSVGDIKKKRRRKTEFYINEQDAENFNYKDLYYISDIKKELNRISMVENVKKVTGTKIWEYLVSIGLVEECNIESRW